MHLKFNFKWLRIQSILIHAKLPKSAFIKKAELLTVGNTFVGEYLSFTLPKSIYTDSVPTDIQ